MILGLAGNLLKSLVGKKKKISGEKMAQNVMNDSKEKESVVKPSPPEKKSDVKGADLTPLEDIRDDMKASSKKSKDPLNLALDGIDSALFGIIDTLTKTNLLKKKIKSDENKVELDKKKSIRERFLEGASKFVKASAGAAKGVVGNAWDKIMRFLRWTLLGAIVNAIVKNWNEIQKQIQKVVDDLKDLWDSPILKIFREFAMWTITRGLQLTKMILPKDIDKMKEDSDKLKKELDIVEDQYKKIDKGIEDEKKKASGELGLSSDINDMVNVEGYKPPVKDKDNKQKQSKETKKKPNVLNYNSMFDSDFNAYNMVQKEDNSEFKSKYMSELDKKISRYKKSMAIYEDPSSTPKQRETAEKWMSYDRDIINRETGYNIIDSTNPRNILAENDVLYDSSTQTFSKDLKQSPKIVKKFPQPLSLKNNISSYTVGLESYSDDFDESSIILFSEGDETGSKDMGSDFNFDYKMPESTLNIKDAFLLEKLNK